MKKTLLLLFLFLSIGINAQPPGMYPAYEICDDSSNDGFAVFNLTSTLPTILEGLDTSIHEVHFYPSDTDSVNNTNEITSPAFYTNIIQGTQTLGIRIFNTVTNENHYAGMNVVVKPLPSATIIGSTSVCQNDGNPAIILTASGGTVPYTFTYSLDGGATVLTTPPSLGNSISIPSFNATAGIYVYTLLSVQSSGCSQAQVGSALVTVNPAPIANPATLSFCDIMELPLYNLSDADNQITGGNSGVTVSYYETLPDAQTGSNPLQQTYVPLINPGTQRLYAAVRNPATVCSSITTLTLNTHNCGTTCPAPPPLMVTNVTDTTFMLSWLYDGISSILYASVVPQGESPSNNNLIAIAAQPAIPYLVTGLSPEGCYSIYVKRYCNNTNIPSSDWSEPLNICMPNCANSGNCAESLILNAFIDRNNNGSKDTGEVDFNYGNFTYQINDSGNNLYGTTNQGSYYIFDSNPANSYDISFAVNPELTGYYASPVTYNNVTLPDGSGANYLYFPITVTQPYTDASVSLYNSNNPRPGFPYILNVHYTNYGLNPIANGTLTFTKDSNLTISSVSQTGIIDTPTGFTYDFTNLAPNEYRNIQVTFFVPTIPTVSLGQLVSNSVTIQTPSDSNSSNNQSFYSQPIVGSYDPNDKSESHGGKIGLDTFTNNDYLYYTIQFENTGTANAEFVKVEDVLNNRLDETTFEMITASHNINTKREGNHLTWHFYSINLPPTSLNPTGSHGTIYFRIKPKSGYAIGDIIPNTASIYFDYNPAIVTNTCNTEFFRTLSSTTFTPDSVSMYPNPASNLVTITNSNTEKISSVVIYEVSGKRIFTLKNDSVATISIDVSHFSKGIYLVDLLSENNAKVTKKLIIQ